MRKHKIGWCSMTWNPVIGCRNHCEYCYARKIAKRFGSVMAEKECHFCSLQHERTFKEYREKLRNFIPVFLESQYYKELPKKPQRIFVGSMSEIEFWREDWVKKVIGKTKEYPQHIFMFLTQHPEAYSRYNFPVNCWLGVTAVRNTPINSIKYITPNQIRFLSIEPILEKIDIENIDDFEPDWIIVGAETGNRKGKVIPRKEWVEVIIDFCNRTGVPIYIKDNLTKYFPEFKSMKEFPKLKK